MSEILVTDTYGDPVIVRWETVTMVEEVRHGSGSGRKFEKSRVWFTAGSPSSAYVRETVPQILQLVELERLRNVL